MKLKVYSGLYPSFDKGFRLRTQEIKASAFYSILSFVMDVQSALLRLLR